MALYLNMPMPRSCLSWPFRPDFITDYLLWALPKAYISWPFRPGMH